MASGLGRIRAMYRVARRVCRCHGMDRDEAQQPPPTCWLPPLATGPCSVGPKWGVGTELGRTLGMIGLSRKPASYDGHPLPIILLTSNGVSLCSPLGAIEHLLDLGQHPGSGKFLAFIALSSPMV